ncbi:Glucose-repressible alcohol dehydrogenase transcriptional effector [Apophysomyces ossiformis]|uniref:CCR4-Not complex 3'-5'-exoribonuclease subunit Ccr4 n=1 Tax=Apophysomyces ossiformis TaxID=679940 RepID=A0A8H7BZ38_9FUNG|nr:Glucose-repressible alcohol dehydrogenase transcriptional effector [Apophysomyces ossiformis]
MSVEKDRELALNGFPMHGHSLQMYNSSPLNRSASPSSTPAASSPSVGNYHIPMYTNNSFTRYTVSMGTQQKQHPQEQHTLLNSSHGVMNSTELSVPLSSLPAGASSHVAKQLTYAQISRQSASPHHHARTAAAMARSTPVVSTVVITDPNNPTKTINGLSRRSNEEETTTVGKQLTSTVSATEASNQTWSTLDIGGMGLRNISPVLCTYTFLTVLYMNHNNITYLTPALSKLVNLKTLDASGNKLASIPPELGLLINLRELLLFDNELMTIPNELGTLYQLETLGLEGNPMQPDIKNLLMKEGTAAVILSLRENAPVGMPPPQREWIILEADSEDEEQDKFTVLCYNTLCQKYTTTQAYGYTASWALTWEYRRELIISEIISFNADIICLQEVEMNRYDDFFYGELKRRGGYDGVFYPKSRAKTMSETERGAVDGCATFYKTSRFNVLENFLLEYNQKALQRPDFKKTEDIYNRVMPKDNIAVMTVLENKDTLARVLVANSHIHWDPSFADVKLVQVGMLMDELDKLAARHLSPPASSPNGAKYSSTSKLPTVVCGDFNSVPDSGVYEFLSRGSIKQNHDDFGDHIYGSYTTEGLSHSLSLKSTYSHIGELAFTNYTPRFKGVLDYIWYTNNTIDVLSLLGPLDNEYTSKTVGFPNAHFPSDHIPLVAEFRFKAPRPDTDEPSFAPTSKRHS